MNLKSPRTNCIYFEDFGRCSHPDRPKFLFFRRMCVEPENICYIKEQNPKPNINPHPPSKSNDYKRNMIGFLKLPIYIFVYLFMIVSTSMASDITLKWDANSEHDLAGYKIYYRTDPTIPYTMATPPEDILDKGASPIIITILDPTNPNYMPNTNPEFKLTGLDLSNKDYWLVVTAYDNEEPENESGYSNEVNTIDLENTPSSDIEGSGGGSGGGCFINTLTNEKL